MKKKRLTKGSSVFASVASSALFITPALSNAYYFTTHTNHSTSSQKIVIQDECKQASYSNTK
jgi:hypothetical protein